MSVIAGPYGINPIFNVDAANLKSYPGSGTTWIDSVNNNNLTAYNSPTYSTNNGGIFNFVSASSQYFAKVTTASDSLDISTALTMSVWFKANSWPSFVYFVAKNLNAGYGDHQYALNYDPGEGGRIVLQLAATNVVYNGFGAPINEWINIIATWNGTTATIYRNGSIVATGSASGPLPFKPNFLISSRATATDISGTAFHIDGSIAQVQISNTAISGTAAVQLFHAERGRFGI